MKPRILAAGGLTIEVSPVALGTMSLAPGPTYPTIPEQQAIDTIHAAMEAGITFFDTAPMYGDGVAQELLGKALAQDGRRGRVVIADKASGPTLSAAEIAADCETALKRLRTDVIDLYQIHWARRQVPLSETLTAMDKLRQAGKVRMLGVCNFGPLDLAEALAVCPIATDQVAYSLLARGPDFALRPMCVEKKVGMLCYSPLAQGLLCGKYRSADEVPAERARTRHFAKTRPQARHNDPGCEAETFAAIARIEQIAAGLNVPVADLAGAWALHQPGVTAVLAGASRPDQAARNARCAEISLSPDTLGALDTATSAVKAAMGPSLDMWQSVSRIR